MNDQHVWFVIFIFEREIKKKIYDVALTGEYTNSAIYITNIAMLALISVYKFLQHYL
jgi:hypothetical protein